VIHPELGRSALNLTLSPAESLRSHVWSQPAALWYICSCAGQSIKQSFPGRCLSCRLSALWSFKVHGAQEVGVKLQNFDQYLTDRSRARWRTSPMVNLLTKMKSSEFQPQVGAYVRGTLIFIRWLIDPQPSLGSELDSSSIATPQTGRKVIPSNIQAKLR
jgi:hypothetical protein